MMWNGQTGLLRVEIPPETSHPTPDNGVRRISPETDGREYLFAGSVFQRVFNRQRTNSGLRFANDLVVRREQPGGRRH